jgi:pimeloyl-ACP methyl ester carboxylesterase
MNIGKATLLGVKHLRPLLLLFISTCLLVPIVTHAKDKPYPGKLIDIGTHRLHINCIGNGSPTVIIDSGIGGFSLEWLNIQNNLAKNVRVCSYDRAGYGWSEPGPRPRTTERITYELHHLLAESKIPGPYVLVGHSFGGYNIRYFASKYPESTAGLILIDASHPEQFNTEEFKRVAEKQNENNYRNSYKVRIIHPIISDSYPAENKRIAFRLMSTMTSKSTLLNEMDNMEVSARQVTRQTNHPPYIFPVTILTRGQRVWAYDELGERRELQWLRLQNDLEKISMQSKHYLAKKSGHIIHLDQPEFVSNNIMSTILKIRSQFYEQNLSKKFNIRVPHYLTSHPFEEMELSYPINTHTLNEYSISYNPVKQLMFHPKFKAYSINSTFYLP